MSAPLICLTAARHCFLTAFIALFDLARLLLLTLRPPAALADFRLQRMFTSDLLS